MLTVYEGRSRSLSPQRSRVVEESFSRPGKGVSSSDKFASKSIERLSHIAEQAAREKSHRDRQRHQANPRKKGQPKILTALDSGAAAWLSKGRQFFYEETLERSSRLLAPLRHEPRKGLPPRGVVDSLVESVKPGDWESGDHPKESGWELWEFSEPLKMKGIQLLVMNPINALLKQAMTHLLSSSKSRVLIMVREVGPAWVLSLIKKISRKLEVQLIVSSVTTDPDDATIERMNAAAMQGVKFKVFPARAASTPGGLCDVHGGLIIADGEVVLSGAFSLERCSSTKTALLQS